MANDKRFERSNRLRRRRDIERVFRSGVRREGRFFSFRILPKSDPTPRLLVVAGKRTGPATRRNRIKRGVREGFRANKDLFAHRDVVVLARPESGAFAPGEIARRWVREYQEVASGPRDPVDEGRLRAEES